VVVDGDDSLARFSRYDDGKRERERDFLCSFLGGAQKKSFESVESVESVNYLMKKGDRSKVEHIFSVSLFLGEKFRLQGGSKKIPTKPCTSF
jgi:hypothetical protein